MLNSFLTNEEQTGGDKLILPIDTENNMECEILAYDGLIISSSDVKIFVTTFASL